MCQAKIILQEGKERRELMRDVIQLEIEGDLVRLSRFFEPVVEIRAAVKDIDFLKHTVTMLPLDEDESHEQA